MSSHRQILYQIVFGTKNRKPTIAEEQCEKLYKYIWGIVKESNCKLYRINGIPDHIYIILICIRQYRLRITSKISFVSTI